MSAAAASAPVASAKPIPSEDVIARKFDNCVHHTRRPLLIRPNFSGDRWIDGLDQNIIARDGEGGMAGTAILSNTDGQVADLLVNAGLGFGVGVVTSVLLFRRRGWPVALSTGFGAGVAYSNCNFSLNPYILPGTKVLPTARQ